MQAVIGITCLVSVIEMAGEYLIPTLDLHSVLKAKPGFLWRGELWRPLTANLVHVFGVPHLAVNMLALFVAGPPVEQAFGSRRFVALYVVPGYLACAVHSGLGRSCSGASGAVIAVSAGLLVYSFTRRRESLLMRGLLAWAILLSGAFLLSGPVFDGLVIPPVGHINVADDVHVVGFCLGLSLAAVFCTPSGGREPPTRLGS